MPRCVRDRRPVAGDPARGQGLDEGGPVVLDPGAHPGELHFPPGPQLRVAQDRGHDVGPVRRRVRVVRADRDLHVALGRRRVLLGAADDQQGADALVVEGEALGERGRDQELRARPDQPVHPVGVLADPVAEALVGEVDEGEEAALLDDVADRAPESGRWVDAGRVVARAVEEDRVAGRRLAERGQERLLVDPPAGWIGVGVGPDPEAGQLEELRVVRPRRLAHPDRRRRPRPGAGSRPPRAARRCRRASG